jgi:hypothetical protein
MRQLGVDQTDDMAPVGEGPGVGCGVMFASQLAGQVRRNMIADLTQDVELTGG